MTNTPDDSGQGQFPKQSHSRRGFFKWMKQVAVGISLAGIGLGITNPANVLAMSENKDTPDCTACPCDGCEDYGCAPSPVCGPNGRHALIRYYGGCVPCRYTIVRYVAGCC